MSNTDSGRRLLATCQFQANLATSGAIERTLGSSVPDHLHSELHWAFRFDAAGDHFPSSLVAFPAGLDPEDEERAFVGAVAAWCGGTYVRQWLEVTAVGQVAGIDLTITHMLNDDMPAEHESSIAYLLDQELTRNGGTDGGAHRTLVGFASDRAVGIEAQAHFSSKELGRPCAEGDLRLAIHEAANHRLAAQCGANSALHPDGSLTVPLLAEPPQVLDALDAIVDDLDCAELLERHVCVSCADH